MRRGMKSWQCTYIPAQICVHKPPKSLLCSLHPISHHHIIEMGDDIVFKKRSGRGAGSARQKEKQKSPVREAEEESSTPTLSFKEKQKARKQPRRSNLSFGGGDDASTPENSFKTRKSLLSQSISNRLPSTTATDTASNYSQIAIDELKADTPTRGDVEISVTDDMDSEDGYSDIARRIYGASIKESKEGVIPTTTAIKAAKKKRQAGVQSIESDYLSLNGGSSSQALTLTGDTGGIESRLQHEDDVFDDDGRWLHIFVSSCC